ncbi:ABC transporter permease [Tessaracoccus sp. Y1736]
MRAVSLLREAVASAMAARVPTILILLAAAAMTFAAAATSGRGAALQEQLEQRLEDAGARVIAVTDQGSDGFLTPEAVSVIADLSSVDTVAAVTKASTVTNAALGWGGPTVSAWGVVGTSPDDVVTLRAGRWPEPGEAIVSATSGATLRMEAPSGALITRDNHTYAVVGTYDAAAPFDWLRDGAIYVSATPGVGEQARVIVDDVGQLGPTERGLRRLLAPTDPANLGLSSPRDLAETSQLVGGDVRLAGYETTLIVLLVGALFVGAVALADVLIRQRDLGRRRALGITRVDLMSLIVLRAALSTTAGAVLGIVAVTAFGTATETIAPLGHTAATATLVVVAALVATVPAGMVAAHRDPVAVLRTA